MARLASLAVLPLITLGFACSDGGSSDGSGGQSAGGQSSGGQTGGGAGGSAGSGMGGSAGMTGPPPEPASAFIPTVTGTCPGFKDGEGCVVEGPALRCTFQPAGVSKERTALVYIGDNAFDVDDSPLVFFWHGNGLDPDSAYLPFAGLGPPTVDAIIADNGLVISPDGDDEARSETGFAWWADANARPDDFLLTDEMVACAMQEIGIDIRRIHSTGISAGGLMTGQLIDERSGYIASAAPMSGGQFSPTLQDPNNLMPVALMWGGMSDVLILNFEMAALTFAGVMADRNQFHLLCNHGGGHRVGNNMPDVAWQFFKDHPFGTTNSPYADGLPPELTGVDLEGVCALP